MAHSRHNHYRPVAVVLCSQLLIVGLLNAEVPIEHVQKGWLERQKSATTVRLAWTEKHMRPKGARVFHGSVSETLTADETKSFEKTLIVSEGRIRVFQQGTMYDVRKAKEGPHELTVVFNNGTAKSYDHYLDNKENTGSFAKSIASLSDATFRPPMYAIWPLGISSIDLNLNAMK